MNKNQILLKWWKNKLLLLSLKNIRIRKVKQRLLKSLIALRMEFKILQSISQLKIQKKLFIKPRKITFKSLQLPFHRWMIKITHKFCIKRLANMTLRVFGRIRYKISIQPSITKTKINKAKEKDIRFTTITKKSEKSTNPNISQDSKNKIPMKIKKVNLPLLLKKENLSKNSFVSCKKKALLSLVESQSISKPIKANDTPNLEKTEELDYDYFP